LFWPWQLTASAIKPRVKPWVDDFRLVNHDIDDEELAGYEAQDPFVQQLVGHLDGFLAGFRAALLPRNYETLVETLTTQVPPPRFFFLIVWIKSLTP